MSSILAHFLQKRSVCSPSVAFAASYTGPIEDIIVQANDAEWAVVLAALAIKVGATPPDAGSTMLTAILGTLPATPELRQSITKLRADVAYAMTTQNAGAQRTYLVRACQNLAAMLATMNDPTLASRVCPIVQQHVDASKLV